MKSHHHSWIIPAIFMLALPVAAKTSDELHQQALSLVKQFGGTLMPQLKQGMQQGGPEAAIEVCASKAPQIAADLSAQSGWNIHRVSLKNRNENAIGDDWEQTVLHRFEQQLAAGTPAKELEYAEEVAGEYRFMKAQVTAPLCLTCHGTDVAPSVQQKIKQHYPNDAAMGYQLGEVRGAFSLSVKLK